VVAGIQAKLGIVPQDLLCGTHAPEDPATAQRMLVNNEPTSTLRHNCSGKHSGMLAQCLLRGLPTEDYINPKHPVQQTILQVVAEMTDVAAGDIILGTDGCSAPVFALPLKNAALAFARLADPTGLPEARQTGLRLVFHAMTTHPEMVAGPEGFDTRLMQVGRGKILTKVGAEGFQAVALLPGACGPNSPAMGIALKISDGDRLYRARTSVIVSLLRQLGALDETQVRELAEFSDRPQFNWRRIQVGEIRSIVKL
jgi:L-asparaginase II